MTDTDSTHRRACAVQPNGSVAIDTSKANDRRSSEGVAEDGVAEDGVAEDGVAEDGVTQFRLLFNRAAPPAAWQLSELRHWRNRLVELDVVGQNHNRYTGIGFGNLSTRHPGRPGAFIITGTQTGAREKLGAHDFAVVTQVDIARNQVVAHGGTAPSSEAMTHAVLYQADATIVWVFHGHAPTLWSAAERLHIASTPANVGYGTQEMALAVRALRERHPQLPALIRMGGHEDGIIAFGGTADSTGRLFEDALAHSRC